MQQDIVVGRLDPVHCVNGHQTKTVAISECQPLRPFALLHLEERLQLARKGSLPLCRDSFTSAPDRRSQPFIIKRLQQIIDGIQLERADRILVIGSYKNYSGHALRSYVANYIEPGAIRHLHIEQDKIRAVGKNRIDGLQAGIAFPSDLDPLATREAVADALPN